MRRSNKILILTVSIITLFALIGCSQQPTTPAPTTPAPTTTTSTAGTPFNQ